MNMDYSKAIELLNQDAEKERNEKAEKAVHDNLYNKGYRDGSAALDGVRAEVESHCGLVKEGHCRYCSYCNSVMGVREILEIIDRNVISQ